MANLPEGFVLDPLPEEEQQASGLPPGFVLDPIQPPAQQAPEQPAEQPGLLQRGVDLFTGRQQMTPEIEGLQEIGSAPEMNELSLSALKASVGLLATGDEQKGIDIIKKQIPDAQTRKDEKGNVIIELPSGEYLLNRPGFSGQDLARFVAQAATFTPAGRAATVGRAAAGAGVTEAGLQATAAGTGAEGVDIDEIALAAGLGAAGKGIEEIASAVSRARRGEIGAEEAEILRTAQAQQVPVMTSDVLPPQTFVGKAARKTGEQVPFIGTGQQRAAQQQAREEVVNRVTQDVAPDYDTVVQSLAQKTRGIRQAAGKRLEEVGDQMEQVGAIQTTRATDAIDEEIAALTAPGRVPDEATVNTLQRYKDALEQGQSFKTLDTLRSDFREAVKGERQSLPSRSQAASERIYKALTDDLKGSISDNIDARTASRFMDAKGIYANEMNTLKKTRLKSILDKGDVTPEVAKNALLSQKPSEMAQFYKRLNTEGRQAARATIMHSIVEKASSRVGGMTPDSLATQIGKHKASVNAFFRGEEREQLKGLQRLLDTTREAQQAAVVTPTGQQAIPYLVGGAGMTMPIETILGAGTVGGLARLYESPQVRNALLRLASIPKGSDRYDQALREAFEAVQIASQAARDPALD